jgi:hypothetical protein
MSFAQDDPGPDGEGADEMVANTNWVASLGHITVEHDRKVLTVKSSGTLGTFEHQWSPPLDLDISYAMPKDNDPHVVFILLDDGSIYEMILLPDGSSVTGFHSKGGPTLNKLVGDALYGISTSSVYLSRDSAATFQVDTVGLGSGYAYDIGLDTLQYVYLASSTGLFRQHPDTSIWRKVASFPVTFTNVVFVDRKNRIFVASSRKIYLSTNSGTTWNIDTTGLNVKDILGLKGFCDDAFGNIYVRSATELWRSTGGTQPWTHIDQPLSALAYDPSVYPLFNSLSGDTLLYAATVFGSFVSSNQGATWSQYGTPRRAQFTYGFVKTSSGRRLASTSLGIYYKGPGDLQWTKTFPTSGFLAASPVFLDGSGSVYALGAKTNSSNFNSLRANWKSTDGGLSWNPDTVGIGGLAGQNPTYFVDETGTQHYGAFDTPAKFYRKTSGQSWTPDTSGYLGNTTDYPTVFASDKHGSLYVATVNVYSGNGMLWKRPIGGGTWVPDTAGLAGAGVYWITADKNGVPLAGTISGVYRKNGSTWTKLPSPSGLNGYSAFVVSVDSSGYTVAGFSTPYGLNYFWRGLYATKNNGATWTYLGLDSISVLGLVSYGDTTYAYTYADGLYKVRSTAGATSVGVKTLPTAYGLEQNYPNPFNPTTTIRFSLAQRSRVSLKIFDILGREVATLVNDELEAGFHQSTFDASKFASGIYFYRIQAGNFTATKKLVLLK